MDSSQKTGKISDEDKIESAEKFKLEGNEQYKSKNYKVAIGKYHRAIIQLKAVGQSKNVGDIMGSWVGNSTEAEKKTSSPEILEKTNSLKRDCYNNLAACMLQQEDPNYEKIIQHCDNVLEVSDGNVKALYRKGVALYHMKDYEEALQNLQLCGQNDSLTRKYLTLCKEGLAKQEQELKSAYQKMFKQPDKT